MTKKRFLIAGAGLCGLSAAYHLEKAGIDDYLVLEANSEIGGLARTETYSGFSFDHSIHILYTGNAYVADLICNKLLQGNLVKQPRESFCYTANTYTEYPYQANNFGLPVDIITDNIMGLIDARFKVNEGEPINFSEWIYRTFGRGIAENFMIPYNQKQWAWDLKKMSYDWIAGRVPTIEVKDVLVGALQTPERKFGPNREFWYPKHGGIESLVKAFATKISKEKILLNSKIKSIDSLKKTIVLENNQEICYEYLFSTLPLPQLFKRFTSPVPDTIKKSVGCLKSNVVHTVNIGLIGSALGLKKLMHWVYYPDNMTVFHRLSFPHSFAKSMVPEGCVSIQAEISESEMKPICRERLIQDTLEGLCRVGILSKNEVRPVRSGGRVKVAEVVSLNPAYVIYDLNHRRNMKCIFEYLEKQGILTRGRFGEWEYMNMDHAILSGKSIFDFLKLRTS